MRARSASPASSGLARRLRRRGGGAGAKGGDQGDDSSPPSVRLLAASLLQATWSLRIVSVPPSRDFALIEEVAASGRTVH